MAKYIDAEKLKELIDEKWKELADKNVKAGGGKWDAEISTYLSVLRLIDSLQQEQQETKPSLLKSLEEYFEKTPKEQLDADWEKFKAWNEIGPDAAKYCKAIREQQEVNLENEIIRYRREDMDRDTTVADVARHFYELGKNSK